LLVFIAFFILMYFLVVDFLNYCELWNNLKVKIVLVAVVPLRTFDDHFLWKKNV